MAFGGACRLWVRRCASPPVITSMPAVSCSNTAACIVRNCASDISAGCNWPIVTRRSRASYQRGTLYAPIYRSCVLRVRRHSVSHRSGTPGAVPKRSPPVNVRRLSGRIERGASSDRHPINSAGLPKAQQKSRFLYANVLSGSFTKGFVAPL
jgi:hypothetical protein